MCGYECYIYVKIKHSSLLSWRERFCKKLKVQSCNAQNRRFGEMVNSLFKMYKNTVIPHEKHMFQTESKM